MSLSYQADLNGYPEILAQTSDVTAYLGPSQVGACLTATAAGTLRQAEAGCGLPVARDGVSVPFDGADPRATLVANGRNELFVRTHFRSIETNNDVTRTSLLSLQIKTESEGTGELCDDAVVMREEFHDGIHDVAIDGLPDPTDPYNSATLYARDKQHSRTSRRISPLHACP